MSDVLRYQGLVTGHGDGLPPRLNLVTPAGRIRRVTLTRRDLTRLISQAAAALEVLDREAERAAR